MSIQAIDRTSVHRLTSGQVVVDLQTAVKELVENALDAGATSIDILFRESGVEAIEVKDNGKGINQCDWEGVALKHHTSKLASFADLAAVQTLGFRGEALSSLCGVATLSMVTSTAETAPMGTTLSFTSAGVCVPQKKIARERGTTVRVERLFDALPVRRKELIKNAQRELGKALALIQAYALINSAVRFEAKNVTKGKTLVQLKTTASTSLRTTFSYIFSPKDLATLLDLDLTLQVETEKNVLMRSEEGTAGTIPIHVRGLVSKPSSGNGRAAGNRQFFYINGRPIQPGKVAKTFNEVYKSFNTNQFPCVVANFQLAPDAYDVNVSPDKRTIFLHSEGSLLAALKQELARFFDPQQARFEMRGMPTAQKTSKHGKGHTPSDILDDDGEEAQSTDTDNDADVDGRPRKRSRPSDAAPIDQIPEPTEEPAAPADEVMDATALFASPHDRPSGAALTCANDLHDLFPVDFANADDDDSDSALVLPDPPSPLKRALLSLDDRSRSSSRSPIPLRVESETSLSTPIHVDGTPLFRRASPTPRPPSPHSPSPEASPTGPSSDDARTDEEYLRQTTLDYLVDQSTHVDDGTKRNVGRKASSQDHPRGTLKRARAAAAASKDRGDLLVEWTRKTAYGKGNEDKLDEQNKKSGHDGRDDSTPHGYVRRGTSRVAEHRQEDDDAASNVDNSSCASSPGPASPPVHGSSPEPLTASRVCVHGSQEQKDDSGDESDVVVLQESAAGPDRTPASPLAPVTFGAGPAEVSGHIVAADAELAFDRDALSTAWSRTVDTGAPATQVRAGPAHTDELSGAAVGEREDEAEATLSRIVSKDDFAHMEVVGQFNLGFIIVRRRVEVARSINGKDFAARGGPDDGNPETHDDLFIVDQHASDEKFNFEKLQSETVIQSQRLIAPRILNLPSADELTALEHVEMLRFNGFDVLVDEDADVGERVKLIAQPVSKDTVFDTGDFEELVELIRSRTGNEVVRPSKARRMFASRACRKSVMIGKALNVKQMTQILRNMSSMEQPWVRHLPRMPTWPADDALARNPVVPIARL